MTADAVELLRDIRDELRALRADLAGRQRRLAPADRDALERLLPIIASTVAGRVFGVAELAAHARLPSATALREALASIGGSRKVGRLLARAAGADVNGLRVVRVGEDSAGALWSIEVRP